MRASLRARWDEVWFRPAPPLAPIACRVILCGQALWVLLSRPDLPELVAWPREFWAFADLPLRWRFGIVGLSVAAERGLFWILHLALATALLGVFPRVSCLAAGLLLYHFAPFEEIFVGLTHTDFGGLTLPTLGLCVLAFAAAPRLNAPPSPEHRWPTALVQLLFAFHYFFAAVGKIWYTGLGWFHGDNVRGFVVVHWSVSLVAPWARWVAESPLLGWLIVASTAAMELAFPLVILSQTAANVLAPMALVFHVGIVQTMDIAFLSLPFLLLYLDWERIDAWRRRRAMRPSRA